MTLRSRNLFVRASVLLMAAGVAFLTWRVALVEFELLRSNYTWASTAVLAASGIPLLGGVLLSFLFRRTMSSPVFFVTCALIVSAGAAARLAIPGGGVIDPVVAMRVVVVSHLGFALFLFAAGLHAAQNTYRRHAWVLFAVCFVALTLSWTVPVDSFALRDNLTHPVALGGAVGILAAFFLVLGVVSYLQVGIRERDRRGVVSGVSLLLLAIGYELLFYSYRPVAIGVGSTLLVAGVVVFAQQSYRDQIIE